MSEREEKQLARSERPTVTPQPTSTKLFDWVEDKFNGPAAMPKSFELRLAFGPGGAQYRPETVFQKEFLPNIKKPEREQMVEIANKIQAVAQDHCNELGKPQGFVVLAFNAIKSAHPYGIYYMKVRPNMFPPQEGNHSGGGSGDGEDILSDGMHRDGLLRHSLEHMKSNDEHFRFMYDGMLKAWASTLSVQQDIIAAERKRNESLESQRLEWVKAIQESASTVQDRNMKAETHAIKMKAIERGVDMVLQMVPVVAKTLERNKTGALPAAEGAKIEASPESIAVDQFIKTLDNDQKTLLFGSRSEDGAQYNPGIFTLPQVNILGQVAQCQAAPSVLELLLPGGEYAVTDEQMEKAQHVISVDRLMPLYAMIVEGQKQRTSQVANAQ